MSSPRQQAADPVTSQGNYAGSVSRFVAYAIDLVVTSGVFAIALAAISYAAKVVTGHSITWNRESIGVTAVFIGWQLFYLGYSWAASGRTVGMAVLGVRVVRVDGAVLDPRRAAVRAIAFPLSFLVFGLGFIGILVQREHRALHDLIAGTAVVYSWDARAARLRFLARETQAGPGKALGPAAQPSIARDGGFSTSAAGDAAHPPQPRSSASGAVGRSPEPGPPEGPDHEHAQQG